jgi:ABC-type uncharacterized transport system ATPase subunit
MIIGETPLPRPALGVDAVDDHALRRFHALDNVELKVRPGSFHALLGENGAGKSTLVKCIMGYYHPTEGDILVGGREQAIANPRDAHTRSARHGLPALHAGAGMTVAENLVLARDDVPAVVDWPKEKKELEAFLARMPFKVPLDKRSSDLAAGEKQKLEILKQLYLKRRFLILDEPTSVLTPGEADEVLGMLRAMVVNGRADHPDDHAQVPRGDGVRRRGDDPAPRQAGRHGKVAELTPDDSMARMMIGAERTDGAAAAGRRSRAKRG